MDELAPFEKFKFNVGDLVSHVSDDYQAMKGMVLERALVQTEYGFYRWYSVAFGAQPNVGVTEAELKPHHATRL